MQTHMIGFFYSSVGMLNGYLKSATDTLTDINKYAHVREKTPLDLVRNKNLRYEKQRVWL
jgi:hypothetical protein